MRVPFIVYSDFECFTEKLDTCQPNDEKSYTKQYQKQHQGVNIAFAESMIKDVTGKL